MGFEMIEQLISLTDAARRIGVSVDVLKRHIKDGTIRAIIQTSGEIAVPESEMPNTTKEQFKHLKGNAITVTDASARYHIPRNTILNWARYGHALIIKKGYRMELDECDIAYLAYIYHRRGGGRGKVLIDDAGRPYRLKDPKAAAYRSEYRKRKARGAKGEIKL
jgi:hypothetical protein